MKKIVASFASVVLSINPHVARSGAEGFLCEVKGVPRKMWISKAEQEGGKVDYGNGPQDVEGRKLAVGSACTVNVSQEEGSILENYSFSRRDGAKEAEAISFQATASLALDRNYQAQLARTKGLAQAQVVSNPMFQGLFTGQGTPTTAAEA